MTSHQQQWKTPTGELRLSDHEVHVWKAALNASSLLIQRLQQLLSEEEIKRASSFVFQRDRYHFIVAHAVLRTILGHYLRVDPYYLRFETNPYGKPSLVHLSGEPWLNFNLAHSHELALYVFTYTREVGIDVEHIRADFDFEELARHSFSPYEQSILRALPEAAKQQAFFRCWARKEAYIKAKGKGLSIPLDLFDVSLEPGKPPALISSPEGPQEMTHWSFIDLDPCPGYASALVVEGSQWDLNCWLWQEENFFPGM